jgi:hypothetical protein
VFEVGSGWYPFIPIGMVLCGAAKIWTFDVEPLLSAERARLALSFYARYAQEGKLQRFLPCIDSAQVQRLLLLAQSSNGSSAEDILAPLHIYPSVGDASKTDLPSGCVDFFFSNTTLQYIPKEVIAALFAEFRRLAAPGAVMSHYVYTGDDFALFDRSITPYNFLRFSDREWALLNGPIHRQNRLRLSEYRTMHTVAGWTIKLEDNIQGNRKDLQSMRLAERFRSYSAEDLLTIESWMTSQCV